MSNPQKRLLAAMRVALKGKTVGWNSDISGEDWNSLFQLAQEQQVLPMVYEAVVRCPAADAEVMRLYKSVVFRQIIEQVKKTAEFLELYKKLCEAGVRPLVVKGLVCRNIYPNPDARSSGDEDILVMPEQAQKAHEVMLAFGMQPILPDGAEPLSGYETAYGKPGSLLHVELHQSLFPPEQEAYGELNRFFSDIHENAVSRTIQDTEIWMPEDTQHEFFLICHAFKHFLHSGFGIRQVSDIALFGKHYNDTIDWDWIFRSCREIHGERFAAAVFRIGSQALGIPAPAIWQRMEVDEKPMLMDLLASGVYGNINRTRQHSSNITLNAVAAQKQGKDDSSTEKRHGHMVLRTVFPSANQLKGRYSYLKKHPILLPVAWADRLLKYRKELQAAGGKGHKDAMESVRLGQHRIELLRKYGIID